MKDIKIRNPKELNNIKEILYNSAEEYSENIAFVIKHQQSDQTTYTNITYKQFLEDINSLGSAFYMLNLRGKRVAIIGKNRYEWAVTHMCNQLGSIVSVPLDKDLPLAELESSLIRSKADAIVFDPKLLDFIQEIKDKNNTSVKEFICMDKIDNYKSIPELIEIGKDLLEKGKKEFIENKINNDEMSILLFTSGTTAQSKAVMLSQKNIASNIYAMQCVEDVRSTDTNIALLPFHHIFGSTGLLMMIACGIRTVFPDGLRYIKKNMQEYGVSIFVCVPLLSEAIYKAVTKEIEKQGKTKLVNTMIKISNFLLKFHIDLRRVFFKRILAALGGKLRLIISGGAPADPLYIKGFHELGVETVQGYGLSETSPVIAAESRKFVRPGSVGAPMVNDTIEIFNKDSEGVGEICVKGPNVMLGYYEMPELTNETIVDGWFHTGDLGYFDKDGFLYLTGRSKNLIVLKNGKKIFPEEIETLVNRIDLVSECMVFGMPNPNDKNDISVAVKVVFDDTVIKEKYSDKSEDELNKIIWDKIKEVNNSFPKYKHIQRLITSHEELIKTTTKKVKRQEEMKLISTQSFVK